MTAGTDLFAMTAGTDLFDGTGFLPAEPVVALR